jgi:hypothetical protein
VLRVILDNYTYGLLRKLGRYTLGVCPPDMPLDWVSDGVEDEDPSFAILDAIEEDFHRVKKGVRLKIKGRRDVLNMKRSIDYGDASVPSRRRK